MLKILYIYFFQGSFADTYGSIEVNSVLAKSCRHDWTTAYNQLKAATCNATINNLSGLTIT